MTKRRLAELARWPPGEAEGQLQFLPAYSPELNRIEILWHLLKYYWLTPADYQVLDALRELVEYIVKHIGTDCTLIFG